MFSAILLLIAAFRFVYCVEQNITCPNVTAVEVDVKALDGIWYISEAATDIDITGNCARIVFTDKNENSTDLSIQWGKNTTRTLYNGTATIVAEGVGDILNFTFSDQRSTNYKILTLSYDHYALLYSCKNNDDALSSNYELWKLSRTSKLTERHAAEMDKVIANYNITFGMLNVYSTADQTCYNGAVSVKNSLITILGTVFLIIFK